MVLYGIMNALAMAFAPAVSINLYHVIGYRHAIIISAASALLVAIIVQFVSDRSVPKNKPQSNQLGHIKIIQKNALPVAAMTALFAIPYFATQADIVTYV
ncbi:MFS transporter, partial [Limosilactobacillus mucosae]|nr:MFS transporter [Limosilactobacillus mucosae]